MPVTHGVAGSSPVRTAKKSLCKEGLFWFIATQNILTQNLIIVKLSFLSLLFLCAASTWSQNLVQNPSFEDTLSCPQGYSAIDQCIGWTSYINSPDFLHSCSSTSSNGIPNSIFGYQYPSAGEAQAGFYAYHSQSPYPEFLGASLSTPLIIGEEYYVSFDLSLSKVNSTPVVAMDKIGVKFLTYDVGDNDMVLSPDVIDNNAHVFATQIVNDTMNWVTISGSFIADSAYSHFLIGQFFDTSQVQKEYFTPGTIASSAAYYFLDNVCITSDPMGCNFDDVSLPSYLAKEKKVVRIIDMLGREINDQPNTVLIYVYDDGSTEKIYRME